jgi:ankyrin repeat protein
MFLNYSGGPIKNNLYTINVNNKEFDNKKYLITLNKLIDENGNNNLQIAVKRHLIEFVQYFIDKKLDINYQNNFGDTALHIAMVEENLDIIQLLLNNNADLLIKNNERKTPFDLASGEIRKVFNLESLILEKKRK